MKRLLCVLGAALLAASTAQAGAKFSSTQLFVMGDPSQPVAGAATLLRRAHGIEMTLNVDDLAPGHVYTIWFVVFNNPDGCQNGINRTRLNVVWRLPAEPLVAVVLAEADVKERFTQFRQKER